MADYYDDDEGDDSCQQEERLHKNLLDMQDMLRQLNEAKHAMDDRPHSPYNQRGRGGYQQHNPKGRGGYQQNNRRSGVGYQERNLRGRGGYQERSGERRGRARNRGHQYIPQFENYFGRGAGGRGRGQNYRGSYGGHGQPSSQYPYEHEASSIFDNQHNSSLGNQLFGIRPQLLVESLVDSPDFSCSLLQLLELKNMQPASVRDVAFNYPYIFSIKNEVIELKPEIGICSAHCGSEGCQNPGSCKDLHICDKYVMDYCHEKNCILGHKWRTGHNDPVLRPLLIEWLPFPKLRRLLQLAGSPVSGTCGPLNVCDEYNEGGCEQRNCASLHVCLSFVTGLTQCNISDCQLNHDLLSPSCCLLLEKHGIPTNEAPRDVLVALLTSNPSLHSKENPKSSPEKKSKGSSKPVKKEEKAVKKISDESHVSKSRKRKTKKKDTKIDSSQSSDSETSSDAESGSVSNSDNDGVPRRGKGKKNTKINTENITSPKEVKSPKENVIPKMIETRRTLWSHYLQGDVPITEICYYSVEGSCRYEGSGCQRLHATKHFHWQVSEPGKRWLNLRPEQVMCLEYAYSDPAKDSADLPRLDPTTLDYSVSGLLILMGRETWQADFMTMVLTNASKTKTLNIRRLCTETIDQQKMKPGTFVWYFSDKNGEWVQYGNVDTAGASHLISNITSDEIEKHFSQNPTASLPFKNSKYSYVLDFKTMTQMNLNTRVTRKVIRRPTPHLQDEKKKEQEKKASVDLPEAWEKMQAEERVRLVSLAPSSSEYKTVVGLLSGQLSSANVMKIQRIQNPFLWRALQNKIKEMTIVYKDASKVNVRQLFHGTTHNIVSNICAENFDWRLHGSKSGQSFGRGTYFATDANYSYNYANPDSSNMRHMFIARVAVGTTARGDSSMVRPPTNPSTSAPFDSTVDNVSNPTIIVKYDKQEYYPEYLLTLA